jgi:hypothetical protein
MRGIGRIKKTNQKGLAAPVVQECSEVRQLWFCSGVSNKSWKQLCV